MELRSPKRLRGFWAACLLCPLTLAPTAAAQPPATAVLIQVQRDGSPVVTRVDPARAAVPENGQGLIVWAEDGRDRWQLFRGHWRPPVPEGIQGDAIGSEFALFTRGERGGPEGDTVVLTTQLAPLHTVGIIPAPGVIRGWQFLTPADKGRVLDPKPTFRRIAEEKGPGLPVGTARLLRGDKELLRLPFKDKQARLAWAEIPDLPKALAEGLPPGTYTLQAETPLGIQSSTFTVEESRRREEAMRRPRELERLLGGRDNPLYGTATVEHLLAQRDPTGRPTPYTADALDLLEQLPEQVLTPYLSDLRKDLLRGSAGGVAVPAPLPLVGTPTGIREVDAARRQIVLGKWTEALATLDQVKPEPGPAGKRKSALASLYRGVVLAESGLEKEDEAAASFEHAVNGLADGPPRDLFRARNNFANFLLGRAQDRLSNHAFQMATGAPQPLLTTLQLWCEARDQYQAALSLVDKLEAQDRAAVRLNLARLYAFLADVIRTLARPDAPESRFSTAERAAAGAARDWVEGAMRALDKAEGSTLILPAIEEVRGHLALREGRLEDSRACGERAAEGYLRIGSLAGVMSAERLTGLALCRLAESDGKQAEREAHRRSALRCLLISQQLSEELRERFPLDQAGLSRAGYFARQAVVLDQVVELLIAEGQDQEALACAERAKARALQDLLAARTLRPGDDRKPRESSDILKNWPKDVTALEYFLGSERAWVFVVGPSGKVRALPLVDRAGKAIPSRALVLRVQRLLGDFDHQAAKMYARVTSRQGFDHGWQDVLHEFYEELIPAGAAEEMRRAKSVVVVPHHVLHYFPFAALVTERDERPRGNMEMVQPRFLLEEPFDLSYAPSLSVWDTLRRQPPRAIREANALGLVAVPGAAPLEGVEKELGHLRTVFKGRVGTISEGPSANRDRAERLLRKPGLLVIATHGLNLPDRPLESHLLLYPREGDDGRLTADDVFSLEVGSDVIVLNACYSGLGDRSPLPGDDLFGLQRALLQAGARTVVAGLWDIYDGTGPDLMRGFFEGLSRGEPPAAALAGAQREFVKQSRKAGNDPWLHPYFWAVYATSGR